MREMIFIGNFSNPFNKEIIQVLNREFILQVFEGNNATFDALLEINKPDLIFVSLVKLTDELRDLLYYISSSHSNINVLTLGAEYETEPIRELYENVNFDNIERPASNSIIVSKCWKSMAKAVINKGMETETAAEESVPNARKSILLVDDSQVVLRNIKTILEKKYDVHMAVSGSQALMLLGKKHIDLILLDYDMPVMDGKQVFKILKSDPECKDIPVIFLTSVSSQEKVLDILSDKPDGYILKPPNVNGLLSRIEEVIG